MPARRLAQVSVREIQRRAPVRVPSDARLLDVATLLRERRRGAAIVEDQAGKLIGIFTARDLMLRVNHENDAWHDLPVRDVMTTDPVCVSADDSIAAAIRLMKSGSFRHLPLLDSDSIPTGIVSVRDILIFVAAEYPQEFLNLPPDPSHEATNPWGG